MRWSRCRYQGRTCLLVRRGKGWVELSAPPANPLSPTTPASGSLFSAWGPMSEELLNGPEFQGVIDAYEPPIAAPEKILCVGRNYREHAREMDADVPQEPLIFSKLNSALIGHEQAIVLPEASCQVDYEAELVAVIGRPGRHLSEAEALDHVAGYTCGNDVSARDWQKGKPGGQWLLGKSFDTFAPVGPEFVSADEVPNVQDLDITLRLNGTTMQDSNTREMIFPVARLIAYVSRVCRLEPGDLIFTGTPDGVGSARQPPVYLQAGDVVEVEVEHVGLLRNRVVVDRPHGR